MATKLPLGLIPKKFHDMERLVRIEEAIKRYSEACMPIPQEWLDEYNDIIRIYNNQSIKKKTWLWYWGVYGLYSPKIEFTDFDEMKIFSAKHSAEHSWLGSAYWSNYETKEEVG